VHGAVKPSPRGTPSNATHLHPQGRLKNTPRAQAPGRDSWERWGTCHYRQPTAVLCESASGLGQTEGAPNAPNAPNAKHYTMYIAGYINSS
jgi:hypothetical protein